MFKARLFMGFVLALFIVAGCGMKGPYFGAGYRASFVPAAFDTTQEAIQKAEVSQGSQYCPEKIAKAKDLAKQGEDLYWACLTEEAMKALAEARKLAHEAEMCTPPPPPPKPEAKRAPPPSPPPPRIAILGETHFEFDSYRLKPEGKVILDKAVEVLKKRQDIKLVEIAGHTCNIGTESYNKRLSENRARSAKNYMVYKGISPDRLRAVGYGEFKPAYSNETEVGRSKNRRVVLKPVQ
jgi:outer membrane protein OmpA-like peptidoglycan-associated protein